MKVAVIPARGGSKRIPQKNIRMFCGKPMIYWPLTTAINSGCFDRIIVSTDDETIAEIASSFGATVPFIRPAELADDHSTTSAVIAHAVKWLQMNGDEPLEVCCLYATAPFVTESDLRNGLVMLQEHDCDYVFTITAYPFPIQRALRKTQNGRIDMFNPEYFSYRSQDLEPAYHDAAQFYWGKADAWEEGRPIFSSGSVPLVLPKYRVQDVDTMDDWVNAELMFKTMLTQKNPDN